MGKWEITEDQEQWFVNQCNEKSSGKIFVSSYMVKKFRNITADFTSNTSIIKEAIGKLYHGYENFQIKVLNDDEIMIKDYLNNLKGGGKI